MAHIYHSYLTCDNRQSRRSIKEMAMRFSLPVERTGSDDVNFMILLQKVFCEFSYIFAGSLKWFLWFCSLSPRRIIFVPERVVYWPLPISAIKEKAVYNGLTKGYCQPRGLMAPQSFTVSRTLFFSCWCLFAKSTLFAYSCLLGNFSWRRLLNSSLDTWTDSSLYDKTYLPSLADSHLCYTDCDCCTRFVLDW